MTSEYDLRLSLSPQQETALANLSRWLPVDRLLHLHPHWFVQTLREENGVWQADIRDYATDKAFGLRFRVSFGAPNGDVMRLEFTEGPYRKLRFFRRERGLHVEAGWPEGLDKGTSFREKDLDLQLWLRSIREYLRLYLRDSLRARWTRLVMNRMLLRMNPSQRKICIMILRITLVEIIIIIGIIVVFVLSAR